MHTANEERRKSLTLCRRDDFHASEKGERARSIRDPERETEREGEKGRKERGKREREAAAEKFTLQGVMARKEARASERGW